MEKVFKIRVNNYDGDKPYYFTKISDSHGYFEFSPLISKGKSYTDFDSAASVCKIIVDSCYQDTEVIEWCEYTEDDTNSI